MKIYNEGLTLIELTIVIIIIAILAMIAIPMYTDMVRESRRQDATMTLLSIEQDQELHRTNNDTYGVLTDVWGGRGTTTEGFYTVTVTGNNATGYT